MRKRYMLALIILLIISGAALTFGQGWFNWSPGGMGPGMMGGMMQLMRWFRGGEIKVDLSGPRPEVTQKLLWEGRQVYERTCAACHGLKGDGKGPNAKYLISKPRDFTLGVFKFRSTPSGSLPTDEDLFITISKGLRGTAMLPWFNLTKRQKWAVIAYIKTFSDRWEEEEPDPPIRIPKIDSKQYARLVKKGRQVFLSAKCWQCHGKEGHGDGPKAFKLKDDWGNPIRPRDYDHEKFKRGSSIKDIYLTVATGLDGTPMPSHLDTLPEQDIVAVAAYVNSLARKRFQNIFAMGMTPDERVGMMVYHMGTMMGGGMMMRGPMMMR